MHKFLYANFSWSSVHRYPCRLARQTNVHPSFSMAAVFRIFARLFWREIMIIWNFSRELYGLGTFRELGRNSINLMPQYNFTGIFSYSVLTSCFRYDSGTFSRVSILLLLVRVVYTKTKTVSRWASLSVGVVLKLSARILVDLYLSSQQWRLLYPFSMKACTKRSIWDPGET